MMELRTHCATDDFSVPEVNGSRQANSGRHPERRGRSHDRPEVSGVLYGIQDEQSQRLSGRQGDVGQRSLGDDAHGEDALRGIGLGRALKLARPDLFRYNATLVKDLDDGCPALVIAMRRPEKCASDLQWRPKQFLDRAYAFGDEQPVPFASFSATKVASQGQDLHSGICLAFSGAVFPWTYSN
jgi:hypothetical protein